MPRARLWVPLWFGSQNTVFVFLKLVNAQNMVPVSQGKNYLEMI